LRTTDKNDAFPPIIGPLIGADKSEVGIKKLTFIAIDIEIAIEIELPDATVWSLSIWMMPAALISACPEMVNHALLIAPSTWDMSGQTYAEIYRRFI
jgi:hypothetical protein